MGCSKIYEKKKYGYLEDILPECVELCTLEWLPNAARAIAALPNA